MTWIVRGSHRSFLDDVSVARVTRNPELAASRMARLPEKDSALADELDMRLAYRESVTSGMVRLVIAVFGVLFVLFTLHGPLGTRDSLTPIQRLAYFGLCGAMQVPICFAAAVLTLYLGRNHRPRQIALALSATSLVVAAPCAAIAYTVYGLFHAGRPPDESLSSIYLVCALDLWSATALGYYVLCLRLRRMMPRTTQGGGGAANARPVAADVPPDRVAGAAADARSRQSSATANRIADQGGAQYDPATYPSGRTPDRAATENPTAAPTGPPASERMAEAGTGYAATDDTRQAVSTQHSQFYKRLSPEVGRDIVYLRVSGHYVEVTTSGGSDVILMRLADAVDALGGLGMQVHRSYWAAYPHMNRLVRRDGRILLRLTDDREIPVSRPYLKAVRAVLPNKPAPLRPRG